MESATVGLQVPLAFNMYMYCMCVLEHARALVLLFVRGAYCLAPFQGLPPSVQ